MASTVFVDGSTPIIAAWLNDVNNYVYGAVFPSSPTFTGNLTVNGTSLFKSKVSITLGGLTQLTLASSILESTNSTNNYLSYDVQNQSNGNNASSDIVATADTGTDTTHYVNMGINGSGFTQAGWTINGALDAYLYSQDTNLSIGTAGAKYLSFFTGGTLAANERARFAATGNFLVGTTTDSGQKLQILTTSGSNALGLGTASNTINFQVTDSGVSSILLTGANSNAFSIGSSNFSPVNLVANNTTVMTLGTAGQINGSAQAGLRNRIINGDMRIDQRNNGASQTITAGTTNLANPYTVDRFYAACTGANVTGQRVSGSGPDQFVYQLTGAASVSAIAFGQRIESTNIYDLANTTVAFSCKIANSLLTTVTWTAYNPGTTDNWASRTQIATGSFTVNSTLTKYSANIALTSANQAGLSIELTVGAQTSGTFTIGEFQVEPGTVATVFERRPITIETTLCQRYTTSIATTTMGQSYNATSADFVYNFSTPMRTAPTATVTTVGTASNVTGGSVTLTGLTLLTSGLLYGRLRGAAASGWSTTAGMATFTNGDQVGYFTAEL